MAEDEAADGDGNDVDDPVVLPAGVPVAAEPDRAEEHGAADAGHVDAIEAAAPTLTTNEAKAELLDLVGGDTDKMRLVSELIKEAAGEVGVISEVPVEKLPDLITKAKHLISLRLDEQIMREEAEKKANDVSSKDDVFLRTMRSNREIDGICRMKTTEIGELCGVPNGSVGIIIARLVRAGSLKSVMEPAGKAYRVANEDGTFVEAKKPATPSVPAPVTRAGPPTPRAPSQLETQLLDHITLASEKQGGGPVLMDQEWLMKKFGRKEWRALDLAFTALAERGLIVREKSIAGHVTFSLLEPKEVAA
ncbi:hypothetical protein [Fulvimarina endophytica]|uniref:hypothetical protein n=1 Tax=Fulvimarina endophytica TaxID=2293836 RepID=UPI0011C02BB9|nr:hypothetical protein [Fulvimarina endophytica]